MTKGPPALLGVIYAVLAARLIQGRWSALRQVGFVWGVPLVAVLVGAWAWAAYQADAEHFGTRLVGFEMMRRLQGYESSPMKWLTTLWRIPAWFVQRNLPWSILTIVVLIAVPWRRWMRHAAGPAILWIFIVIGFFSLSVFKRDDYPAPAYPAVAVLAAYCIAIVARGRWRLTPIKAAWAALIVALLYAGHFHFTEAAARHRYGEHLKQFAHRVNGWVGDDPLVFRQQHKQPLQVLLCRHQPGEPTAEQVAAAEWIVQPTTDPQDRRAVLVSKEVSNVLAKKPGMLALYRAEDCPSPPDEGYRRKKVESEQ